MNEKNVNSIAASNSTEQQPPEIEQPAEGWAVLVGAMVNK